MKDARVIRAFLPIDPPKVTHNALEACVIGGGPRKGRAAIRKSNRLKDAEDELCSWIRASVGKDVETLQSPLRLTVRWMFPESMKHRDGEPHTGKPDMSNMLKTFEDCLVRCNVIDDDRGIIDEHLSKGYAKTYGIFFKAEEIRRDFAGKAGDMR